MARIVGEIRPRYVFIENSPLLRTRGLSVVLKDLAQMGYDAKWGVLGAHHVSAPHKRQRVWIVAYPATSGLQGDKSRFSLSTTRRAVQPLEHGAEGVFDDIPKPYGLRSYHGVANAVDRIKAIGNGQVPAVARLAWNVLTKNI
jgi:DNA (cytosine-5)-methyltransferase 1